MLGPLRDKFDYRFDMPNLNPQQNLQGVCGQDPFIFVIDCPQEEVELWLQLCSYFFEGTNTLFCFGRLPCVERRERPNRPAGFFRLFKSPCRHKSLDSDQQVTSIEKPFLKNVVAIILFTIRRPKPQKPSLKTTPAHFVLKSTRN